MIHSAFKHTHTSLLPVLLAGDSEKNTGRTLLKIAAENVLEPMNAWNRERE